MLGTATGTKLFEAPSFKRSLGPILFSDSVMYVFCIVDMFAYISTFVSIYLPWPPSDELQQM